MLDVRFPIGALFFILGIMIAAWGYTHPPIGSIETKVGLVPLNIDIVWGWIMTCFGLGTFSYAKWEEAAAMEAVLKQAVKDAAAKSEAPASDTQPISVGGSQDGA